MSAFVSAPSAYKDKDVTGSRTPASGIQLQGNPSCRTTEGITLNSVGQDKRVTGCRSRCCLAACACNLCCLSRLPCSLIHKGPERDDQRLMSRKTPHPTPATTPWPWLPAGHTGNRLPCHLPRLPASLRATLKQEAVSGGTGAAGSGVTGGPCCSTRFLTVIC